MPLLALTSCAVCHLSETGHKAVVIASAWGPAAIAAVLPPMEWPAKQQQSVHQFQAVYWLLLQSGPCTH